MGLEVAAAAADVLAAQRALARAEVVAAAKAKDVIEEYKVGGAAFQEKINKMPKNFQHKAGKSKGEALQAEYREAMALIGEGLVAFKAAEEEALVALAAVGGNEYDILAARAAEANVYWMRKYNPSG